MHNNTILKIGSVVRFKAGGDAMTVAEIRDGCDGTGGDKLYEGWFSESSIELVSP